MLGDRSRHAPGRGLPGAGPLADQSEVLQAVLHPAHEVRVAGPRRGEGFRLGGLVGEVAVDDAHSDRRACRTSGDHSSHDLRVVSFDLGRSSSSPVPQLAPSEVAIDLFEEDGHSRRHTLNDHHQLGTMRLARG